MLYTCTVESGTFKILERLASEPVLSGFHLAGGTALALRLGHRKSVDIDLFSTANFDLQVVQSRLEQHYGYENTFRASKTLRGRIHDVKVDILAHEYPLVNPIVRDLQTGIHMYSIADIAAMKLNAIAHNGTRVKDFIDIAALSTKMSFIDMLTAYTKKYPRSNVIIPMKAVTYYADIDYNEKVDLIGATYKWGNIEKRIGDMVSKPNRIFLQMPFEATLGKLCRR